MYSNNGPGNNQVLQRSPSSNPPSTATAQGYSRGYGAVSTSPVTAQAPAVYGPQWQNDPRRQQFTLPYQLPPGEEQYQRSQPPPPFQQQQQPPATQQQPNNNTKNQRPETPDLLTSPFEVPLPTFSSPSISSVPPKIPPNPEKDALLHAVSKHLAETLQSNASKSHSAAQSLLSQARSLESAMTTLQGEVSTLDHLNATLESNTAILQDSLRRAESVIADAQFRRISSSSSSSPPTSSSPSVVDSGGGGGIDEVLVAPTVVGKQLYELVAEESGIQEAIYALQAALVKGVIGVDTWSRHSRSLAREAFLKRALIRKIGKGMGLEVEEEHA